MLWRSFTFGYISLGCILIAAYLFSTRVALVFVCVAPADFHGLIRWVGCSRLYAGADSRAMVLFPGALSQCFLLYRVRVLLHAVLL